MYYMTILLGTGRKKVTRLLFKTFKNKDFKNVKILIGTIDYKIQNGYVTVNVPLRVQGLKNLNLADYNSIKIIMIFKFRRS